MNESREAIPTSAAMLKQAAFECAFFKNKLGMIYKIHNGKVTVIGVDSLKESDRSVEPILIPHSETTRDAEVGHKAKCTTEKGILQHESYALPTLATEVGNSKASGEPTNTTQTISFSHEGTDQYASSGSPQNGADSRSGDNLQADSRSGDNLKPDAGPSVCFTPDGSDPGVAASATDNIPASSIEAFPVLPALTAVSVHATSDDLATGAGTGAGGGNVTSTVGADTNGTVSTNRTAKSEGGTINIRGSIPGWDDDDDDEASRRRSPGPGAGAGMSTITAPTRNTYMAAQCAAPADATSPAAGVMSGGCAEVQGAGCDAISSSDDATPRCCDGLIANSSLKSDGQTAAVTSRSTGLENATNKIAPSVPSASSSSSSSSSSSAEVVAGNAASTFIIFKILVESDELFGQGIKKLLKFKFDPTAFTRGGGGGEGEKEDLNAAAVVEELRGYCATAFISPGKSLSIPSLHSKAPTSSLAAPNIPAVSTESPPNNTDPRWWRQQRSDYLLLEYFDSDLAEFALLDASSWEEFAAQAKKQLRVKLCLSLTSSELERTETETANSVGINDDGDGVTGSTVATHNPTTATTTRSDGWSPAEDGNGAHSESAHLPPPPTYSAPPPPSSSSSRGFPVVSSTSPIATPSAPLSIAIPTDTHCTQDNMNIRGRSLGDVQQDHSRQLQLPSDKPPARGESQRRTPSHRQQQQAPQVDPVLHQLFSQNSPHTPLLTLHKHLQRIQRATSTASTNSAISATSASSAAGSTASSVCSPSLLATGSCCQSGQLGLGTVGGGVMEGQGMSLRGTSAQLSKALVALEMESFDSLRNTQSAKRENISGDNSSSVGGVTGERYAEYSSDPWDVPLVVESAAATDADAAPQTPIGRSYLAPTAATLQSGGGTPPTMHGASELPAEPSSRLALHEDVFGVDSLQCSDRCWAACNRDDFLLGSTVYLVNGVVITGLDRDFQLALIKQKTRPIILGLTNDLQLVRALKEQYFPEGEKDSSGITKSGSFIPLLTQPLSQPSDTTSPRDQIISESTEISAHEDRIKYSAFVSKYRSSAAARIRKQTESTLKDYVECDWATAKRNGTGTPQATVISLYRFVEFELNKLDLFNGKLNRGAGFPVVMEEHHWQQLQEHIETFIFCKVSDFTRTLWHIYSQGNFAYDTAMQLRESSFSDLKNDRLIGVDLNIEGASLGPRFDADRAVVSSDPAPATTTVPAPAPGCIHPVRSGNADALNGDDCRSMLPVEPVIELSPAHPLHMKLAFLRFLTMHNLGLEVEGSAAAHHTAHHHKDPRLFKTLHKQAQLNEMINRGIARREEWYLALRSLYTAVQYDAPSEIVRKMVSTMKLISHALDAYVNRQAEDAVNVTCACGRVHLRGRQGVQGVQGCRLDLPPMVCLESEDPTVRRPPRAPAVEPSVATAPSIPVSISPSACASATDAVTGAVTDAPAASAIEKGNTGSGGIGVHENYPHLHSHLQNLREQATALLKDATLLLAFPRGLPTPEPPVSDNPPLSFPCPPPSTTSGTAPTTIPPSSNVADHGHSEVALPELQTNVTREPESGSTEQCMKHTDNYGTDASRSTALAAPSVSLISPDISDDVTGSITSAQGDAAATADNTASPSLCDEEDLPSIRGDLPGKREHQEVDGMAPVDATGDDASGSMEREGRHGRSHLTADAENAEDSAAFGATAVGATSASNPQLHKDLSADDLMPAVTWCIIQANPPNIEYVLWVCNEFRHPALQRGESAYWLAQLSSAVEFCRIATHQAFEIPHQIYNHYMLRYNNTLKLLLACKQGDLSAASSLVLKDGADCNGLSPDFKDCPLTACIRFRRPAVLRFLLSLSEIEPDILVNLYTGIHQRATPLIIAAQYAQLGSIIALLNAGANRYHEDDGGNTALGTIAMMENNNDNRTGSASARVLIEAVLQANPSVQSLVDAVAARDEKLVVGLLLQNVEVNYLASPELLDSPLIVAVRTCNTRMIRTLLNKRIAAKIDVDFANILGETPLIVCAKMCAEEATEECVVIAAMLLRFGADRYTRDKHDKTALDYARASLKDMHCRQRQQQLQQQQQQAQLEERSNRGEEESSPMSPSRFLPMGGTGGISTPTAVPVSSIDTGYITSPSTADAATVVGANPFEEGITGGGSGIGEQQQRQQQQQQQQQQNLDAVLEAVHRSAAGVGRLGGGWTDTGGRRNPVLPRSEHYWLETMEALLTADPGPEQRTVTPALSCIYEAARNKDMPIVRALLYQGCDVNEACPRRGYTAAIAATYCRDAEMLELLLQADALYQRADYFAPTVLGTLPALDREHNTGSSSVEGGACGPGAAAGAGGGGVHTARFQGIEDVDDELSERANILDLNKAGRGGMTPLHYAAQLGDVHMVGLLLRSGARRDLRNDKHHTALDVALANDRSAAADLLRFDPAQVSICLAAKHGDWNVMRALLIQGVSINTLKTHNGSDGRTHFELYTPLLAAAAWNQGEILKKILEQRDVDVNLTNPLRQTALMFAAAKGSESTVLRLLKRGADRWLTDNEGCTAAQWARARSHEAVAQLLLNDPAREFVHDAIRRNAYPAVVALLKQGVSVNMKRFTKTVEAVSLDLERTFNQYQDQHEMVVAQTDGNESKASAASPLPVGATDRAAAGAYTDATFHYSGPLPDGAASSPYAGLTKAKSSSQHMRGSFTVAAPSPFSSPAAVPSQTSSSSSSTAAAATASTSTSSIHSSAFSALRMAYSAPSPSEGTFIPGETPLIIAARYNRLDTITLLLKAPDIEVNMPDTYGWTALFHAAAAGQEEAVLLLLRAGASRNLQDREGVTVTMVARSLGYLQIAAIIDADPYKVHIHDVCADGALLMVTALLKQGCPPTFRDERPGNLGQSPLMAASSGGKVDVVRMLLRSEAVVAAIDTQDSKGRTALMRAAAVGALDVTALLLSAGCDRTLKDHQGLTARDHASKHSFSVMIQFISQNMVR